MKKTILMLTALTLCVSLVSCFSDDQGGSQEASDISYSSENWTEYKAQQVVEYQYSETETRFLVEGDIVFTSEEAVKDYFNNMTGNSGSKSSGHLVNGNLDKWDDDTRQNLTYKIEGFSRSRKAIVKQYMDAATQEWEAAADLNFIDITGQADTPLFVVKAPSWWDAMTGYLQGVIASAFFPSSDEYELTLYSVFFKDDYINDQWNTEQERMYTVCHELGHVLGLRHEHIWGDNGVQTGEASAPAQLLTEKDPQSIMWYPHVAGYTGDGTISDLDEAGVNVLYQ
ncbi:MAG: matrixin family metalloprotease [bacterium]|nr:matrixin family metalloprotease [bacterium]